MIHVKSIGMLSLIFLLETSQVFAADHDPKNIIPLLKDSKMTLLSAVEHAEKTSGVATSAKFEVSNDGKLKMSVYTIPEGLSVEPEKATLTELIGNTDGELSGLTAKVFTDKEHIARSSVHMTLFQMSKLTLKEIILKAQAYGKGVVIDIRNPKVKNHRAIADVVVVNQNESVVVVSIDLLTGIVKK